MRSQTLILAALALLIGLFSDFGTGPLSARAQQLDAGKPPAQIFSSTCSACHRSARGLVKNAFPGSLPGFLRQHYTTGDEMARAMAAYVLANGGSDRVAEPPPKREPKQKAPETAARNPEGKELPKSRRQKDAKKGKSEPAESRPEPAKTDAPVTADKPGEPKNPAAPAESAKEETPAPAVAAAPAADAKAPEMAPAPAPPRELRSTIRLPGFPPPVDDPTEPTPAATATAPSASDVPPAASPAAPASTAPQTSNEKPQAAAPVDSPKSDAPKSDATKSDATKSELPNSESEKQTSQTDDAPKLDIMQEEVHTPLRGRTVQQKKREP